MAVIELTEPSADVQQKTIYNSNVGGHLNRKAEFSVPSDTTWAVVGTVLADVATPADVTSTLIPAIEALAEVTSVNGDQLWGQVPATIEAADHEAILHVSSAMSYSVDSGDFAESVKSHKSIKPPVARKWCVFILRLPSALDPTKVAALEAAIQGITGITTAVHLIDGTTSARQTGNAALTIWAHVRIDYVHNDSGAPD